MKFITPLAMLIAAVWIFFGYTMPEYGVLTNRQAVAASYGETLGQANQLNQLKNSLLTTYKSIPTDSIARLDTMLPSSINQTHFVVSLANLAATNGVTLNTIQITSANPAPTAAPTRAPVMAAGNTLPNNIGAVPGAAPAAAATYKAMTVDISVTGPYAAVKAFTHDLEQSLQLIDIVTVTVQMTTANMLQESLSFKTYTYSN